MSKMNRKQIGEKARSIMEQHPGGIRWMELLRAVEHGSPETPHNSVHGGVHHFLKSSPDVVKIAKGTYVLAAQAVAADPPPPDEVVPPPPASLPSHIEHQYYDAFAEWLIEELEEANHAEAVGGNILRGKWGTPDVIGVLRPRSSDLIKFEPQIVSAEIKTDPGAPVVAFGQAVAYRLFSHKSYMVMPESVSKPDLERMDALATIYGIGLVTFALDPSNPSFQLRVRATQTQPDMFYVNDMARRLLSHSQKLFNSLF